MIDEKWRAEYRGHRYLEDISDDELLQRGRDSFRNFMTINTEGKASPLSVKHPLHAYWRMRFVHFLEECALRFGPYPSGIGHEFTVGLRIPNPKSKRVRAAITAIDRQKIEDGKYLVKYGKFEYLKPMLYNGVVRVSPASVFSDDSLNDAIRDTELELSYVLYRPSHEDLRPYLKNVLLRPFVVDGSVIVTETLKEDFYLFCLSASYDPRLFDDFDADACLLIKDPVAFSGKLLWGVHNAFNARGHAFSAVTYVDPLTEMGEGIHPALKKNARYSYQDEVRAVWLIKDRTEPLKTKCVQLGSLEGIAQIVAIE